MKTIWICMDIVGTYGKIGENIDKKTKIFSQINELAKDNKVIFSFISTDDVLYVKNCFYEVMEIIKNNYLNNIQMGPQIGGEQCLYNNDLVLNKYRNKGFLLLEYASIINEQISEIIFIDDNPNTNLMFLDPELTYGFFENKKFNIITNNSDTGFLEFPFNFYCNKLGELDYVIAGMDQYIKEKELENDSKRKD